MGISASNTGRIWANADLKVDALALDSSTTPLSDAGDAKGQTLGPQQASQVRLSSRDHSGQSGWLGRTAREHDYGGRLWQLRDHAAGADLKADALVLAAALYALSSLRRHSGWR